MSVASQEVFSTPMVATTAREAAVETHLETSTTPKDEVMKRIEAQLVGYVESLVAGKSPCIQLHDTPQDDVEAAIARKLLELTAKRGPERHAALFLIWASAYNLLRQGKSCTLRELYYNNATTFRNQAEANTAVVQACASLGGISRHSLGIYPSVKGLVAGLIFVDPSVIGVLVQ